MLTKDSAHQKAYNNLLFSMGHAIARELACCFFASITAFDVPIPHDVGGHWENWTFKGAILNYNEVGLDRSKAGTLWLLHKDKIQQNKIRQDKIQQIVVPDLAKEIPHGKLPHIFQVAPICPCC